LSCEFNAPGLSQASALCEPPSGARGTPKAKSQPLLPCLWFLGWDQREKLPAGQRAAQTSSRVPIQLRVFRDDFGLARFRPDVAPPFFVAGFVALRVELFADFAAALRVELFANFAAALRFGADFELFAAAFAGARFFAVDVFAFVGRLVGWLLARLLRAAITAPDTAPITEPTTGVPTAVPTTAPATAPPRVLLAAPFSSLDRMSFLSSSVMFDLQM
jgi:hypothetical protein